MAGTEFDFTEGRLIGVTRLDTGFTGLRRDADGRARVELDHPDGAGGATLWADERFGYFMVFTGDTLDPGVAADRGGRGADDLSARCPAIGYRPDRAPPRGAVDGVVGDHPPLSRPRCSGRSGAGRAAYGAVRELKRPGGRGQHRGRGR